MNREDILKKIPDEMKNYGEVLLDNIVLLQKQLREISNLPFIEVNPKNPMQQRQTVAAKLYPKLLQKYNESGSMLIKLMKYNGLDDGEQSELEKGLAMLNDLLSFTPTSDENQ